MLEKLIKERNLPPLQKKEEMIEILQQEEYGYIPPKPATISWEIQEKIIPVFCAGKAILYKVTAHCMWNSNKCFSFPFYVSLPAKPGKHPFFIHVNFRNQIPDIYMPTEELIDNGFAVLSFCYNDVTKDNEDFSDGLAGVLLDEEARAATAPGKIAMWAWAIHRVMDYAQTLGDVLDLKRSAVCGHSRLGKTALLAAATDERIQYCYSNNSGCSGAAISRGKKGETVKDICERFPYWFCENYKKYANNEQYMPFDQHYLLACVAPRKLLVGSAALDIWADPESEMLCCYAASAAFDKGFICNDRLPAIDDVYLDGDIGYHLRDGHHYFGRTDWHRMIQFMNKGCSA